MSDQYEYVDEEGNPVDPAELGDDVEFVDEEVDEVVEDTSVAAEPVVPTSEPVSAPTAAAAPTKVPKALLAGVAAVVLLVGGGAAYGLSQLGNQDTVQDAKAAVTEKTEQVKDEARADIDACDGRQVAAASYGKGGDTPKMQLRVTSITALPPGYGKRVEGLGDRAADRVTILQQSTGDLGVYVQEEATKDERTGRKKAGAWWKVSASTDGQGARVLGEEQGTGEDVDAATACETVKGGVYQVVGDQVPDAARGMRDGQVVVDSLKPDGASPEVVWLVMGDQLARSVLEYAPAQESEADDAEETTTATATTEKGR
ncbi:hypothetical protein [Gordonia sihwensis]|uniref:hypothetical protein n=1 Tax=Gordonia sihwensis TaxID=173559 RepID=UPI003D9855F2